MSGGGVVIVFISTTSSWAFGQQGTPGKQRQTNRMHNTRQTTLSEPPYLHGGPCMVSRGRTPPDPQHPCLSPCSWQSCDTATHTCMPGWLLHCLTKLAGRILGACMCSCTPSVDTAQGAALSHLALVPPARANMLTTQASPLATACSTTAVLQPSCSGLLVGRVPIQSRLLEPGCLLTLPAQLGESWTHPRAAAAPAQSSPLQQPSHGSYV